MASLKANAREFCPPALWRAAGKLLHPPTPATPEEDEFERLKRLPSGSPTTVRHLVGAPFETADVPFFLAVYRACFKHQTLSFRASREDPLIIDGGANEGVTVRYWKTLYPRARIEAYEPDSACYSLLQKNCGAMDNVRVHRAGLWNRAGEMQLRQVGGLGSHLACLTDESEAAEETIRTVRLRDLCSEPIDFLKLDIEGAEIEALEDCGDVLNVVDQLFVEYHSFIDRPQRLSLFFSILEKAGYRMHVHDHLAAKQPFLDRPIINRKDLRLNVFCYRQD